MKELYIGIDIGYGNTKGSSQGNIFASGVLKCETTPPDLRGVIRYEGTYYMEALAKVNRHRQYGYATAREYIIARIIAKDQSTEVSVDMDELTRRILDKINLNGETEKQNNTKSNSQSLETALHFIDSNL